MYIFQITDEEINELFQGERQSPEKEEGPPHTGGMRLDQLNDDVLLKILSSLNLIDLCSLFHASTRFRPLTEQRFAKYKRLNLIRNVNFKIKCILLMTCGAHIEILSFSDDTDEDYGKSLNLGSAMRYCTNLKSIHLDGIFISMDSIPEEIYARFFGHLEEMYMRDFTIRSIQGFPFITHLKKLVLNIDENSFYRFDITEFLKENFTKNTLEYLHLKNVMEFDPELFDVVSEFRGLRVLNISISDDEECYSEPRLDEWFTSINDHLTELRDLTFSFMVHTSVETNIKFVLGASNLKKLGLMYSSEDFDDIIAKLRSEGREIRIRRRDDLKLIELGRS